MDGGKTERANDRKWKENDDDVRSDVVNGIDTPQRQRRQAGTLDILIVDLVHWMALKYGERSQDCHEDKDDGEQEEADLSKDTRGKYAIVEEENGRLSEIDGELVVDLQLEEVLRNKAGQMWTI